MAKKINIPSYEVRVDDVITVDDKMQKNLASEEEIELLPFLQRQGPVGKLLRAPKREDIQVPFDIQLIIEYYSR